MITKDLSQLKLLAIFSQVAEGGSFAAAARKLGSSRSRISEQVSLLEQQLNTRLLQRTTRQLTLTQEGKRVYQQARQLPQLLEEIHASVRPAEPQGKVSITLNHDIAHRFLLPQLPLFRQQFPKIKLNLILDDHKLDLIEQEIDLAIRIGFPKDDSVVARMLHQERMQLYAAPALFETHSLPHSIDTLSTLPWVQLGQSQQHSGFRLRHGDEYVELSPDYVLRCNSPLMVQKMVVNGLGVGLLLPTTVMREIEEGKLMPLLPEVCSDELVFSLIYPSRKHIPMRTRAVIDFLLACQLFN